MPSKPVDSLDRLAEFGSRTARCSDVSGQSHYAMSAVLSLVFLLGVVFSSLVYAIPPDSAAVFAAPQRDGSRDFDFLIGDWKAHVRRLPDRLNDSSAWNDYDGISNHKKLLDTNANFEEFDVISSDRKLHIKAQTLRMYNPATHQWSIYGVDLDAGVLELPPLVGQFSGNRGEFYNQQVYKGRVIIVRYIWLNVSPKKAHMDQSFSPDGGKSWEVNWVCELTR
jgi:hypothetical protein